MTTWPAELRRERFHVHEALREGALFVAWSGSVWFSLQGQMHAAHLLLHRCQGVTTILLALGTSSGLYRSRCRVSMAWFQGQMDRTGAFMSRCMCCSLALSRETAESLSRCSMHSNPSWPALCLWLLAGGTLLLLKALNSGRTLYCRGVALLKCC